MSLTRIYGVRMPGMTPEMVDMQYFGEMPGIPPYRAAARRTRTPSAPPAWGRGCRRSSRPRTLPELRADQAEVDALVDSRPDLSALVGCRAGRAGTRASAALPTALLPAHPDVGGMRCRHRHGGRGAAGRRPTRPADHARSRRPATSTRRHRRRRCGTCPGAPVIADADCGIRRGRAGVLDRIDDSSFLAGLETL